MISLLMALTLSNFNLVASKFPSIFHVDYENFKEMMLTNQTYVDKSLLIDEILNHSGPVILIARPRNWGKSLNLNMIDTFFNIEVDENGTKLADEKSINRLLFTGGEVKGSSNTSIELTESLKIANITRAMEHLGCYPVIFLKLGGFKAECYHDVVDELKFRIGRLLRKYGFVKKYADETQSVILDKYYNQDYDHISAEELNSSLGILSELLFKHFHKKVFVLIDDYDDPINSACRAFGSRIKYFKKATKLLQEIFYNLFEINPYLEKGVVAGNFVLSKMFSKKGGKISGYTSLDEPFSRFFGFTESEVGEILSKASLNRSLSQMKKWYGGYRRHGGSELFNPWSTMQCVRNEGDIAAYWYLKGELTVPRPNDVISPRDVSKLVERGVVVMPIMKQIDYEMCCAESVYSMCLFNGYLTGMSSNDASNRTSDANGNSIEVSLTIPNEEVRCIFMKGMVGRL